ncbi:MAG: hypothetical protein EOO68_06725 [Moraxellaceae bacterium]|nr:MAG: hypothetical protein EOO68_06725 [Moraxellaceae bacterium]
MKCIIASMFCLMLVACGGGSSSIKSDRPIVAPLSSSSSSNSSSFAASSIVSTSAESSVVSVTSSSSSSTETVNVVSNGKLYGLYVSLDKGHPNSPLGSAEKQDAFLKFVRDNGFNYLIMYGLEGMSASSTHATELAALIKRSRAQYGVVQIGAALGSAEEANTVVTYNKAHTIDERIDVLNVEYEFWNMPDRVAAFANTINMLNTFKAVGLANNMETEIYIGWITAAEGEQLANAADRILVHYYRTNDETIIDYGIERLQYLAAGIEKTGSKKTNRKKIRIAPIFSAEGPTNTADVPFMGTWLETHSNDQAFQSWLAGYNALNASWKSTIDIMGGTWFVYEKFLDIHTPTSSHIVTMPVSQSACVGDTRVFTVTSSALNKRYCWSKAGFCLSNVNNISGAETDKLTIANITNADFGKYSARVVSNDTVNPTSFASEDATLTLGSTCN